MARRFYEQDADLSSLKDRTVAVIGYGSQGHAHALNLRDSGLRVVVAEKAGTSNWDKAQAAGFQVVSAAEAARLGDVIVILVADTHQPALYREEIAPQLTAGKTLMFAHGFNIHYGQIVPPPEVDVSMIAPKAPGHRVRELFKEGVGVPALVAVHQNPSGQALQRALAYAKALGCLKAGVIETTFKEETETDLFGEQVVLCGGLTQLIMKGFETLVQAGYQPEIAYFECCHEVKLIVDLIYEKGISNMRYSISDTAEYGDLTRGPRIISENVVAEMRKILGEIQRGEFAREWILENQAGRPVYRALKKQGLEHPIEKVGEQLRSMMSWLGQKGAAKSSLAASKAAAAKTKAAPKKSSKRK